VRSDGTPTYNLAVVVDDHDMGITHVIRGVDHLTNAARQTQIYAAMEWDVPVFAHVPLIHGPDGAKLSKRHGALGVEGYKEMGYLPAALRNYLVRLGWSHGDDEIISTAQMIDWFDLPAIGRSPARFDFAKLEDLNGHYIRSTSDQELLQRLEELLPFVEDGTEILERLDADMRAKLLIAMPGLKERAKTLRELLNGASFLFAERPIALDNKAAALLDGQARERLAAMLPKLEAAGRWQASELEEIVRTYAETVGAKLGKVAQPLRAALTGKTVSPPVFDVMAVLGREEALARIRDQAA
jgi:glutamyl-tRNA synthetase